MAAASDVNFATLLERPERVFEIAALKRYCADKHVLITGAAGSIGGVLARRAVELGCAQLSLLDHFDHGLLEVCDGLRRGAPDVSVHEVLCDIRDKGGLDLCLRDLRPDLVIHAAALKHVHMAERHSREYILTNVVGSRNILRACLEAGVKEFVFVSTDKAAQPVGVMGASKRLVELYLANFAADFSADIEARSIRFGNVLGSQGSVVPRFQAQIAAGGPILITHPEARRFFMTPREAADFILAMASVKRPSGTHAPTYVLDMGEPQLITDLANRMLDLANDPVAINFTGLRPGEKLTEVLFDDCEEITAAPLPNVFCARPYQASNCITDSVIDEFEVYVRAGDQEGLRRRLFSSLGEALAMKTCVV